MINKDKNILVQITLNKATATKLNYIIDDLSNKLALNLSKSQAIAILINNYGKDQQKKEQKPNAKPRTSNVNYKAEVLILKDKLNVSFPHLSELLDIPTSTLKKYAYGQQEPNGENADKLNKALVRYGIK